MAAPTNTTDGGYFLLWAEVSALPDAVSPSRTTTIQVNNETYTVTQDGIDNTYYLSRHTDFARHTHHRVTHNGGCYEH